MTSAGRWLLASGASVLVLTGLLCQRPASVGGPQTSHTLKIYCAAGLKPPVESTVKVYEQTYHTRIELQYGGSGTLLSSLRVAARGDLFVAGDESFLRAARTNGLVEEIIPLARMTPLLAVRKGNPRGIHSLDDLPRVGFALASPEATAIGSAVRRVLQQSGLWLSLSNHVRVFKPTVTDVANDIRLGTVDAGIVWDATVSQYPDLESVSVPVLASAAQNISIGVLTSSRQPTTALHFARYLGAPEKGLQQFARCGYRPVAGDAWAEVPEAVLFSGGVNRLAIEQTLQQFEKREGARLTRVYNGCGILVSQMKAGQHPDAYLACDVSFVPPVRDLFLEPSNVSETDVVLLVAKGNPLDIRTLADLGRPGLRVGTANPEQSTLGALTDRLFDELGLRERVSPNIKVQTPTADLLVNEIITGSLDAVIVYTVSASQSLDRLTLVPIDMPDAKAVQPYAIARNSKHRLLMERLRSAIRSDASRRHYQSLGFRWREDSH